MVDENKDEAPKVMVGCTMPNGLELRVMRRRNDDYAVDGVTGTAQALEDKGFIKLAGTTAGKPMVAGFTAVDKELWDVWAAENAAHPLMTEGTVFVQPEPEAAPEPEPEPEPVDEREPRGGEVRHGDSPVEPLKEPVPTDHHDETYRETFREPAGQDRPLKDEPTLHGK